MCKCVSTGQGRGAPSLPMQLQHIHTAPYHIHNPASPQRHQRRVDPQRLAQVPRALIADVVAIKAAHVLV
jgi:hypothetical protein